jgi:hypothetical protein
MTQTLYAHMTKKKKELVEIRNINIYALNISERKKKKVKEIGKC